MNIDPLPLKQLSFVLIQALCIKDHHDRVCGIVEYVTPTTYFHLLKEHGNMMPRSLTSHFLRLCGRTA